MTRLGPGQTTVSGVGARTNGKRERGGERPVVPPAEPRSYYGRPILKQPVWRPEVPFYFFAGGMSGAAAMLAFGSELAGNEPLARRAWGLSLAGVAACPPLLISDLGRPARFLNMLRLFKRTSPMSVGSWILTASGGATAFATGTSVLGLLPRVGVAARPASAALGPALSTYTAVLLADTAIPVWHEARRELPFLFAAGGAASAGAGVSLITPRAHARAARLLAVAGAVAEVAGSEAMRRRLGELGEPYRKGPAGILSRAATACTAAGAATLGTARGRRAQEVAGASLVLAGSVLERWAVFRAGFQSARDPKYVVGPQRSRLEKHAAASGAGAAPAG